ncbi:hypothetical protein PS876_05249 [Pseudomonas fluorescens]|nr:hypothetical protein PS876_05249 [Pseudomonas fluorescens]
MKIESKCHHHGFKLSLKICRGWLLAVFCLASLSRDGGRCDFGRLRLCTAAASMAQEVMVLTW